MEKSPEEKGEKNQNEIIKEQPLMKYIDKVYKFITKENREIIGNLKAFNKQGNFYLVDCVEVFNKKSNNFAFNDLFSNNEDNNFYYESDNFLYQYLNNCIFPTEEIGDIITLKDDVYDKYKKMLDEFYEEKKKKEEEQQINEEENNINEIKENANKDNKDNKDIKEDSNPSKKKTSKKIKINEEEIKKDYENSFKYLNALGYTRSFGILSGANFGLIPNPELNECDLKSNKVRYAVLGNDTFWKILTEPEIRFITAKYTSNKDNIGASKELWDLIRQKLGTNSKFLDKIGFEVIYFDTFF